MTFWNSDPKKGKRWQWQGHVKNTVNNIYYSRSTLVTLNSRSRSWRRTALSRKSPHLHQGGLAFALCLLTSTPSWGRSLDKSRPIQKPPRILVSKRLRSVLICLERLVAPLRHLTLTLATYMVGENNANSSPCYNHAPLPVSFHSFLLMPSALLANRHRPRIRVCHHRLQTWWPHMKDRSGEQVHVETFQQNVYIFLKR